MMRFGWGGTFRDVKYKNEIEQQITNVGMGNKVKLWGGVNEVRQMLSETDLFVLPTSKLFGHEEGCPVALMEAMAMERLCIASDVAGSRDLIQDGKNGFLFEPDNVLALKETILKGRQSNRQDQIRSNARDFILSEHTLDKESVKFADVYRKLFG